MDAETTVQRVDGYARAMAKNTSDVEVVAGYAVVAPRDGETPPYAIPTAPADDPEEAAAQLAELGRHFAALGAPLRIELSLLGWRALVPRLAVAGLSPEEETPLFICDAAAWRPAAGAAEVSWVDAASDLAFPLAVM